MFRPQFECLFSMTLHPGLLVAGCVGGRGLHSSTFQLNLSRF